MKFKIDTKIIEKFPNLKIGVLSIKGISNTGSSDEILNLIKEQQEYIRANFEKSKLAEHEQIKNWREAYSLFGAKPKKYKCSVENLYRMTLGDIDLTHINKLVDIYNYISIKHMIPVGGDNVDKLDGDVLLTFAKGDESFQELNSDEIKNPSEGEVVYMDSKDVLCRRWNWRECEKSKMTEDIKNVTLVIEGLEAFSREKISEILDELNTLVKEYCGGISQKIILDKGMMEFELE